MKTRPTATRREVLTGLAGMTIAGMAGTPMNQSAKAAGQSAGTPKKDGIQQSVCQWCFDDVSFEDLAVHAKKIGLVGIDLVGPSDWLTLKKHGLLGTMTPSHGITKGLNRIENHEECLAKIRKSIEQNVDAGFKNVICFSGNRDGRDDEEGLKNCVIALKKIVGFAEKQNITISMELLNSKRNHPDYMCDRTHWGVELAKRVGSPKFGLLYDIYHMQVQEGDVIATIQESHQYITHYHTAGVPGRHEIEEEQELRYPPIVRAILDTGFKGYMAHEFIPNKRTNKLDSLTEAVTLCEV